MFSKFIIGITIATALALARGWSILILIFPPILGFLFGISVWLGVVSGFYPDQAFRN